MPTMTVKQFFNLFRSARPNKGHGVNWRRKGNIILGLTIRSSASSIRKNGTIDGVPVVNEHYKQLEHVFSVTAQTGFDYKRRIDRVRTAAGLESREIGQTVNGHRKLDSVPHLVQQQNGNIGLAVEVLAWGESTYTNTTTGQIVPADYLAPFKRDSGEINYMTPNVKSIVSVRVKGRTFTLNHADYADAVAALLARLPEPEPVPA